VLRGDVFARWDVVLQRDDVVEAERETLLGELDDICVAVADSGLAVNLGRFGPPSVGLVVVEDADRVTGRS